MPQKSRIASQIIDSEAFQLNKNDSCLLGQEQRWALRPMLVAWSLALEKNCEPVWGLKKTTTKNPISKHCHCPGWCQVCALCLGKLFVELVLVVSGHCACPYSLLWATKIEGLPGKPRFSLQAHLASAVSPTELSYFSWSTPLLFLILSWKLNCPPWAKSLTSYTPMPRSPGKPFDWLYYLLRTEQNKSFFKKIRLPSFQNTSSQPSDKSSLTYLATCSKHVLASTVATSDTWLFTLITIRYNLNFNFLAELAVLQVLNS